jgi:hypothetical protein
MTGKTGRCHPGPFYLLVAVVESEIKGLSNYLSCLEESMTGHVNINGVY